MEGGSKSLIDGERRLWVHGCAIGIAGNQSDTGLPPLRGGLCPVPGGVSQLLAALAAAANQKLGPRTGLLENILSVGSFCCAKRPRGFPGWYDPGWGLELARAQTHQEGRGCVRPEGSTP